jgi:hypothetical protein
MATNTNQPHKNAELTLGEDGRPLTAEEQKQRQEIIEKLKQEKIQKQKRLKELINVRKNQIYRGLIDRGLTHNNTLAIMANIEHETGGTYDPATKQGNSSMSDKDWFEKPVNSKTVGRGTGLVQWDDRRGALKQFAESKGTHWSDLETQLDFIVHELETTEAGAFKKLREAKTLAEKAQVFGDAYERPKLKKDSRRIKPLSRLQEQFKPPKLGSPVKEPPNQTFLEPESSEIGPKTEADSILDNLYKTSPKKQFKKTQNSLGKTPSFTFPSYSSYEPENEEDEDESLADSSEPEDRESRLAALEKLSGKTEYSEEPSEMEEEPEEDSLLAKTLEPKEDEEDGYAVKPKRFYSNLYKRLGKPSV